MEHIFSYISIKYLFLYLWPRLYLISINTFLISLNFECLKFYGCNVETILLNIRQHQCVQQSSFCSCAHYPPSLWSTAPDPSSSTSFYAFRPAILKNNSSRDPSHLIVTWILYFPRRAWSNPATVLEFCVFHKSTKPLTIPLTTSFGLLNKGYEYWKLV